MKILFVASEAVPFIKSGGLADVAHALPKKLREMGNDVRVVIPKYADIPQNLLAGSRKVAQFTVHMNWRQQYCGIEEVIHDTIPYYLVDNEYYFKRAGLYGHYDDGERFSYFCRAVLEMLEPLDFIPDVIHLNDWHTGMASVLLSHEYLHRPGFGHIKSVFTIHNLKYQGIFPGGILPDLLNLPMDYFYSGELEFYGNISFMKAGIRFSNYVTTVSPTYAMEIQNPYFGEQMDGIIRDRESTLFGIVNGIDTEIYDPKNDPYLHKPYDITSVWHKRENKEELQRQLGLPVDPSVPMVAMITRLTDQKGLDLVAHVLHEILQTELQLVILGTGDHHYEQMFRNFQTMYPSRLSAQLRFDNALSHMIYGASDLFLMPSLFEPCGLGQLIALRYGSIPIVRETGGLKDTVIPWDEFAGTGNGFSFANYNAHEMLHAIRYGLQCYHEPGQWKVIQKNAMTSDNSWTHSAKLYKELYSKLAAR